MYKQYLSAKKLIENILKENPETRGSDKRLMLKVWKTQGLEFSQDLQSKFLKALSPEVIRRTRQKIQQEGRCLPEEKTQRIRKGQQDAMHGELMSEDQKAEEFSKLYLS